MVSDLALGEGEHLSAVSAEEVLRQASQLSETGVAKSHLPVWRDDNDTVMGRLDRREEEPFSVTKLLLDPLPPVARLPKASVRSLDSFVLFRTSASSVARVNCLPNLCATTTTSVATISVDQV